MYRAEKCSFKLLHVLRLGTNRWETGDAYPFSQQPRRCSVKIFFFGILVCLSNVCGNFAALVYILNHLHVISE